jgi:hypothetical protein
MIFILLPVILIIGCPERHNVPVTGCHAAQRNGNPVHWLDNCYGLKSKSQKMVHVSRSVVFRAPWVNCGTQLRTENNTAGLAPLMQ